MTKKKAKGKKAAKKTKKAKKAKAKQTTKRTTTGRSKKSGKQVDLVAVRKSISNIVGAEAEEITMKVLQQAKDGQLTTMKYLFEVAGLYPASADEAEVKPEDDSLAKILLERMNIPLTPLPPSEDDEERVPASRTKADGDDAGAKNSSSEDMDAKVEAAAGDGA